MLYSWKFPKSLAGMDNHLITYHLQIILQRWFSKLLGPSAILKSIMSMSSASISRTQLASSFFFMLSRTIVNSISSLLLQEILYQHLLNFRTRCLISPWTPQFNTVRILRRERNLRSKSWPIWKSSALVFPLARVPAKASLEMFKYFRWNSCSGYSEYLHKINVS